MGKKKNYPTTCEGCYHCIYLGEGDFLCDVTNALCIEGFESQEYPISCGYFKKEGK